VLYRRTVADASPWREYAPLDWSELRKAFIDDGSLRELVVWDTDEEIWQRAVRYVRDIERLGQAAATWKPTPLPSASAALTLAAAGTSVSLSITIDGLLINTFFWDPSEIEFDLDPRAVSTAEKALVVLGFMAGMARAVGRPTHLTPESAHDKPWLTFDPIGGAWSFVDLSDDEPGPWQPLTANGVTLPHAE
jgi:hypothetical protein